MKITNANDDADQMVRAIGQILWTHGLSCLTESEVTNINAMDDVRRFEVKMKGIWKEPQV